MLRTLCLLSLVYTVISLTGCDLAKTKQLAAEVEILKAQNAELQAENATLQQELSQARSDLEAEQTKLTQFKNDIKEQFSAAQEMVKGLKDEYGGLLKNAAEGLPEADALKESLLKLQGKGSDDEKKPSKE